MKCFYCEKTTDLRPYGPKHEMVCFKCAMSTKERANEASNNFAKQLSAIQGPAVIGTEAGPFPIKNLKP